MLSKQAAGRIVIRAKAEIEVDSSTGRESIIVSEIPYAVNKSELIKKIADLVEEKRLDGISNINDESDRAGMRIVIEVKKDANASVVLNKLFKMTDLQSSVQRQQHCTGTWSSSNLEPETTARIFR